MTQIDRSLIVRDVAKVINWRMLAGFVASTVLTISSVVWTAASLYYNNKREINDVRFSVEKVKEECANENRIQDNKINYLSERATRLEQAMFPIKR